MLRADLEFGVLPREVSAVLFASEQSVYKYVRLSYLNYKVTYPVHFLVRGVASMSICL